MIGQESKEFDGKTAKNNEKKCHIRLTRQPKLYCLVTKAKFAQTTPLFGNLKASNSTETDPSNYRFLSPPKGCNCIFQNVLVFPAQKLKTLRTADINSRHIKTVVNHSIPSGLTTHDKSKIRKRVLFIYKPVWVIYIHHDRIIAWFSME